MEIVLEDNIKNEYSFKRLWNKTDYRIKFYDINDYNDFYSQITEIHPYDDADYAWARNYSDNCFVFNIIQSGKIIDTVDLRNELFLNPDDYEDIEDYFRAISDCVIAVLNEYNKDVEPRMVHY